MSRINPTHSNSRTVRLSDILTPPTPLPADGSATPTQQCQHTLEVANNIRNLIQNYDQLGHPPPSVDKRTELMESISGLIRDIQQGLRSNQLEHPNVYRRRLHTIERGYMMLSARPRHAI